MFISALISSFPQGDCIANSRGTFPLGLTHPVSLGCLAPAGSQWYWEQLPSPTPYTHLFFPPVSLTLLLPLQASLRPSFTWMRSLDETS